MDQIRYIRFATRFSWRFLTFVVIVLAALLTACSSGDSFQISDSRQSSASSIDGSASEEPFGTSSLSEPTRAGEDSSEAASQGNEDSSEAIGNDTAQDSKENADDAEPGEATMGKMLADLVRDYENPSRKSERTLESDLAGIRNKSEEDYELARVVMNNWKNVYANPKFRINKYSGGKHAKGLGSSKKLNSEDHAIVVLGYELYDGEMQDELKGRCDAAAAISRSFPKAMIICTGGPTGENNPLEISEAELMRAYLVDQCAIDESRVLVDTQAMSTVDNAINAMELLKAHDIHKLTIVTSSNHQRRAQTVFAVEAACYRQQYGYPVEIVGNYNYPVEASSQSSDADDRVTAMQIAYVLNLPEEEFELLPPVE